MAVLATYYTVWRWCCTLHVQMTAAAAMVAETATMATTEASRACMCIRENHTVALSKMLVLLLTRRDAIFHDTLGGVDAWRLLTVLRCAFAGVCCCFDGMLR